MLYQFGTRQADNTVSAAYGATGTGLVTKQTADISAWFLDLRGGYEWGPLQLQGLYVWSSGNRVQDSAKRKAIAQEFQEFMTDKLYWNTISGSPFYEVAQPWMKDYVHNAEWKVLYKKVWLDQ